MSRIDCSCNWKNCFLDTHDIYPDFAAKARLAWSKNVNEESEAPWQIMLGSRDPLFCVFIGLAIWLEYYLGQTAGLSPYVFDFSGDHTERGATKSNAFVQEALRKVYTGGEFIAEKDGPLGSHSTRKYSSTRARRSGATKDDRDYRGRWKTDRRVGDRYEDVELPFVDAKVAGMTCVGGPCSYRIKADSPVTDDWILEHVVPNIAGHASYGPGLGRILGKALLWVIFSEKSNWVPGAIVERVKIAYYQLLGEESAENPIEKKMLVITGDDASLLINEVDNAPQQQQEEGQQQHQEPVGGHLEGQTSRQIINTLLHQVNTQQMQITALHEALAAHREIMLAQFRITQTNIRRIAAQPIRQLGGAVAAARNNNAAAAGGAAGAYAGARRTGGAGGGGRAELTPMPRTLYDLWQEYQVGIGGRKAARLFTPQERGRCKFKHSR